MKSFSLKQYMARRRQAAAAASQRTKHPMMKFKSWLERKITFDQMFRAAMRASYFYKKKP